MRAIKSANTVPEMNVRRLIHRMGFRYKLHQKDIPGKPDIVFSRKRKLIFVNGCFWHQHSSPDCRRGRMPKTHDDYWQKKLGRNVERDAKNYEKLDELGWKVLVIWECEAAAPDLGARISAFLAEQRA
jgi:DNA mismatch endonuclease (patch repair protein)